MDYAADNPAELLASLVRRRDADLEHFVHNGR